MTILKLSSLMTLSKTELVYKTITAISVTALACAYYVELALNLPPCVFCIYQRYCYFTLIVLAIIGLYTSDNYNKYFLLSITLVLTAACTLAIYHSGIERGYFKASDVCSSQTNILDTATVEQAKEVLYNKPVASCERAALKVLGISMSEWNFVINLALLVFLYKIKIFKENNAKT